MKLKTFFKEVDYQPTEQEQNFLDFMCSDNFPLFFQPTTSLKLMMYGHTLLNRNKLSLENGFINSNYFEQAKNIFLNVSKNLIKVDKIFRAAVNNVPHFPLKHSDIHVDHDFPHYNFVYHINETNSPTYIFDDGENLIFQSLPKKNRATIFSGMKHAAGSPEPFKHRIVMVFTFSGSIIEN